MKDNIRYLEIGEERYPLVFNINVMEEIQEKYETMSKWGEVVEGEEEPKLKDLKAGILFMINEGIDIENEKKDEKRPFLTSKQLGRLMSEVGFSKIVETIKELTVSSTKTGEEPKNV